jgi:hypothetical protein
MFGFFKKRAVLDHARENGWKGICAGCSYRIRGKFTPAAWRGAPNASDKSRAGTLFACHCPGCGVPLLAWESSTCDAMDGMELYWNMNAVLTHWGELINHDQVIV